MELTGADGADGDHGTDGTDGADGVGILSVTEVVDGNCTTVTFLFTNDETFVFTVCNGVDGQDGAQGEQGTDALADEIVSDTVTSVVGGESSTTSSN